MKRIYRRVAVRSRQAYRFSRLGLNLFSGSVFIQSCHQFPGISQINKRQLNDFRLFSMWVSDLSRSLNTVLHVSGEVMTGNGLFVSNHISWLDTIILNNVTPLSFIARHDLQGWPFLGTFSQRMGSVFIDRENKFKAYRSIPAIEKVLKEGKSVHLFPESTTSDGADVLPFFPMFYEAAVRVGCKVQPISIRYTDSAGNLLREPAFINEDTFMDTMKRILKVDKVYAHVHFCEPLEVGDRKELCQKSRDAIVCALSV
jgi:1-acyl-sn-glycerol-3-phosphate acyltransferase